MIRAAAASLFIARSGPIPPDRGAAVMEVLGSLPRVSQLRTAL
jgi:hypothetical protein